MYRVPGKDVHEPELGLKLASLADEVLPDRVAALRRQAKRNHLTNSVHQLTVLHHVSSLYQQDQSEV